MEAAQRAGQRADWTPDEVAREEQSERLRAEQDRDKSPEDRLEETLRLSRFVSELAQGATGDVRAG